MNFKPNITIIGSCIIDITFNTPKLPVDGESIPASQFFWQVGGKASNQAIGISRLGGLANLVTRIGEDEWGKIAIKLWEIEAVNTKYIRIDPEHSSGIGVVIVDSNGKNFSVSSLGANKFLSNEDIDLADSIIRDSKIISLHLNSKIDTILYALKLAKKNQVTALLNASPTQQLPLEIFSLVDIFVVNNVEASQIIGFPVTTPQSALIAAEKFINLGCKCAVISLGNYGLAVVNENKQQVIPAFSVPVVDTTGAGDALNAALCVAIAEGQDIFAAARFACAVSSLSVSKPGTWASMPVKQEVSTFLKKFQGSTSS